MSESTVYFGYKVLILKLLTFITANCEAQTLENSNPAISLVHSLNREFRTTPAV